MGKYKKIHQTIGKKEIKNLKQIHKKIAHFDKGFDYEISSKFPCHFGLGIFYIWPGIYYQSCFAVNSVILILLKQIVWL